MTLMSSFPRRRFARMSSALALCLVAATAQVAAAETAKPAPLSLIHI